MQGLDGVWTPSVWTRELGVSIRRCFYSDSPRECIEGVGTKRYDSTRLESVSRVYRECLESVSRVSRECIESSSKVYRECIEHDGTRELDDTT